MKARGLMRTGVLTLLTTSVISVALVSTALALSIDFTDGTWNLAQSNSTYTSHPSNVDLSALGGVLTVNYVGGPSGDNSGRDGLGINDDEITQGGVEKLIVAFSAPVSLERIYITDLFKYEGPAGQSEIGEYSLNGGVTFVPFVSVGGSNGALTVDVFQSDINSIIFRSSNDSWSDYSVKGLTYASVPEPSSLLLLGSSFMILVALSRKLRSRLH